LNPLRLGAPSTVQSQAEFEFVVSDAVDTSKSLGQVAHGFGDLTGDGVDDLVFVSKSQAGQFTWRILRSEYRKDWLPRIVDAAWADSHNDAFVSMPLVSDSNPSFSNVTSFEAHLLNWDGEVRSELAVVFSAPSGDGVIGFVADDPGSNGELL